VHAAEVTEEGDDGDNGDDDNEADPEADEGSASARSGGVLTPPPMPSGNQGKSPKQIIYI